MCVCGFVWVLQAWNSGALLSRNFFGVASVFALLPLPPPPPRPAPPDGCFQDMANTRVAQCQI